jgi:gamma-glutamylaminecyclotransferase
MQSPTGEELVFVYGTLRRGYGNHHLLEHGASFLGRARTLSPYALYALEIPFAIREQAVTPLAGEVYAVTAQCLAGLDELEEHPDWYRRELVGARLEDGSLIQAWLYFFPSPQGELIPSGDYADFLPPAPEEEQP